MGNTVDSYFAMSREKSSDGTEPIPILKTASMPKLDSGRASRVFENKRSLYHVRSPEEDGFGVNIRKITEAMMRPTTRPKRNGSTQ
jgi:hypothetical protein